jgi:HEAT repeat protein
MQGKSIDELIGMLGQGWHVRNAAVHALAGKCETDEDIGKVIGALSHRDAKVRKGVVTALGAMSHHRQAYEAVRKALDAPQSELRRAALKTYIRLDPPDAVDVLLRVVGEWRFATALHDAVRELGRYMYDERVVSKLREVAADQSFPLRARTKAERLLRRVPE